MRGEEEKEEYRVIVLTKSGIFKFGIQLIVRIYNTKLNVRTEFPTVYAWENTNTPVIAFFH